MTILPKLGMVVVGNEENVLKPSFESLQIQLDGIGSWFPLINGRLPSFMVSWVIVYTLFYS